MKALIIWHYYKEDSKKVQSFSSTLFTGSAEELQECLRPEVKDEKDSLPVIAIVHQVIVLSDGS